MPEIYPNWWIPESNTSPLIAPISKTRFTFDKIEGSERRKNEAPAHLEQNKEWVKLRKSRLIAK